MSCEKEFGFLTRKHHCRHCGRLVCKACQREMQGMVEWATPEADGNGDGDIRQSEAVGRRNSTQGGNG